MKFEFGKNNIFNKNIGIALGGGVVRVWRISGF
jgi:hypothetical protein